ncbi:hypothetical protein PsorP6_018809 [Peronosclerospora sorghi]|nr:hypothetical protein PsorP6_018800 [Peronosclerospora sorghi]KAI9895207.1 hypothetical protein PsorP6_018809 [Peronosclerospora sorghi]
MSRLPLLWALVVQEEEEEELRDQQLWIEIARVQLAARVRNYVTAAVLPRPFGSPWAMLDRYGDDTGFMAMMRLNRAAMLSLCLLPGTTRFEVDPAVQFYGSRSDLKHLCSVFRITPATTNRCLAKTEEALSLALDSVEDAEVRWPMAQEQAAWGRLVETREPLVTKKFGFIDGKNYQVQQPSRAEVQNAYYNGFTACLLRVHWPSAWMDASSG